jgi:hypothetical protein
MRRSRLQGGCQLIVSSCRPCQLGRVNLIEPSEIPSGSEAVSVARAPPTPRALPPSLDARPEGSLSLDVSTLT